MRYRSFRKQLFSQSIPLLTTTKPIGKKRTQNNRTQSQSQSDPAAKNITLERKLG